MSRRDAYRAQLRALPRPKWPAYLREHSGLPGPRANLELVQAVGDETDRVTSDALLESDEEYLVLCGTVALGRFLVEGEPTVEVRLRNQARDKRWRVREGVALALQRLGDADPARLFELADRWAADDDPLVQRAAVAGVCEPRLLTTPAAAARAVAVCEKVTEALVARPAAGRRGEGVRALRKALGYCWSVAVAANPVAGLPRFQALRRSPDPDVQWFVKENAKKARLAALL